MRSLFRYRHLFFCLAIFGTANQANSEEPTLALEGIYKGSTFHYRSARSKEAAVQIGCVSPGSANQTISVLLLGNSLMGGVKSKIEELLVCGGYTHNIGINNPGGYRLYQHRDSTTSQNLIAQGYDLVLLQEQSGSITGHPYPYPVINDLRVMIEAAGSEMGFYQTWAFSSRDPVTTEHIISQYEVIGEYFSAPVIHIGRAWDNLLVDYNEAPPFSLFSDSVHASTYGQSLIAYTLYAYLTEKSPLYLSPLTLSDTDARILQNYAWDTFQTYNP